MQNIDIKMLSNVAKDLNVLVVDDDQKFRESIKEFLKSLYKEVDTRDNGRDGLLAYKKKNYDLVITDMMMPIINGIELTKQIKEINPLQQIILLTAGNEDDSNIKIDKVDADFCLTKPFQLNSFIEILYHTSKEVLKK